MSRVFHATSVAAIRVPVICAAIKATTAFSRESHVEAQPFAAARPKCGESKPAGKNR
jgi:hypothetical protein